MSPGVDGGRRSEAVARAYLFIFVALASAVSLLVGVLLAGGAGTTAPAIGVQRAVATPARPAHASSLEPAAGPVNFADVAERVNPAVVNIDAATRGTSESGHSRRSVDGGDESGGRDYTLPHLGSGSGFIIDRSGYILTNYHVIEDADRITVTLTDGRVLNGDVVGTDPAIDVALLKVSSSTPLPVAPLGNSDELRVGEWVCAIGNPLGYVHSVTVGVVSFMGRKLFDASLDDYIQTDAAINFGNSGGPLLNARGEVIGINAAISSRAASIGFAVPINQAVNVLPQLKSKGRVSRGFLGVMLTDVTPELQQSLRLTVSNGAIVQDVADDSPAQRAGFRPYDVIVSVEGRDVWTNQELIRDISARPPGTVVRLDYIREGRRASMPVRLVERPAREDSADGQPASLGIRRPPAPSDEPPLGLTVRELDPGTARRLAVPASIHGVIVFRMDPAGAAFVPPMRRGFVIIEINRRPIASPADYQRVMGAMRPGDAVAVYGYDPSIGERVLLTATMDER